MSSIEKHAFDAEIESLLTIITNSMYKENNVFIRELVSNSSDALQKLIAMSIELKEDYNNLRIELEAENGNLVIRDNGIGMRKDDLVNYIGTIAKSGTRAMRQTSSGSNMIGQFGVGFYSSFLVAHTVEVITKHPKDKCYKWISKGDKHGYELSECENGIERGTKVVLHLRPGNDEFLTESKLSELVKKYSSYIMFPVDFIGEEVENEKNDEEVENDEVKIEDEKNDEIKIENDEVKIEDEENDEIKIENDKNENEKNDEIKIENEKNENEKNNVGKPVLRKKRVRLNEEKPIWSTTLDNVPIEEQRKFFKSISNDWDDFSHVKMWSMEGTVNYKLLLFVPKRAPFNMFDRSNKPKRVKLYYRNVFVTDEIELPEAYGFLSGVVAADDLPIGVSRENIQGSKVMKQIQKTIQSKAIELMKEIVGNKENYDTFYKEFHANVKLAVRENPEQCAVLLRYGTSKSVDAYITLDEYVERNEGNKIYVLTGSSKSEVMSSPYLAKYPGKEVVLMYEPMDEVMLQSLRKYKDYDVVRITKSGGEDESSNSEYDELFKRLVAILDLEKCKVCTLGGEPCIVSTSEYGMSAAMEKIMAAQPTAAANPFMGLSKRILEIDPVHPLVAKLINYYEDKNNEEFKNMAELLYSAALYGCGFEVNDRNKFKNAIYEMMKKSVVEGG